MDEKEAPAMLGAQDVLFLCFFYGSDEGSASIAGGTHVSLFGYMDDNTGTN